MSSKLEVAALGLRRPDRDRLINSGWIAEIEDGRLFRVDECAPAPLAGPGHLTVQLLAQPQGGLLLGLEASGR